MNSPLTVLEKNYYKTMRAIARAANISSKKIPGAKLPYLLENATSSKLRPSRCWIISAISGTGKTTTLKQLFSAGFHKLPNVTTRLRRTEEKSNECVFIDNSKFLEWKNRGLLFYPHKRNAVFHAILKKDIKKLVTGSHLLCLDKSVKASIKLKNNLPQKTNFTFVYLLAPTFGELYKRILKRETSRKNQSESLQKKEIFNRFREEINDMKESTKLPYSYIVNDSLGRVRKIFKEPIKNSKKF